MGFRTYSMGKALVGHMWYLQCVIPRTHVDAGEHCSLSVSSAFVRQRQKIPRAAVQKDCAEYVTPGKAETLPQCIEWRALKENVQNQTNTSLWAHIHTMNSLTICDCIRHIFILSKTCKRDTTLNPTTLHPWSMFFLVYSIPVSPRHMWTHTYTHGNSKINSLQ